MAQYLSGFGLFFDSDIAIPGAIVVGAVPSDATPVTIRHDRSAEALRDGDPIYRLDNGTVVFSPPGLGIFRIQGDSVVIQLLSDADAEHASALLIATALPALLWLRGHFMLHAAGVILPGERGVTAIAGVSGAGKSTIAAALVGQGAKLVGDDSLCLHSDAERLGVWGLPGGQFIRQGNERTFHPANPVQMVRDATLERVVILSQNADSEQFERLHGVKAVEQILANRHRPAVPALLGQEGLALRHAARIAQSVPVLQWATCKGELSVDPQRFRDDVKAALSGGFQ